MTERALAWARSSHAFLRALVAAALLFQLTACGGGNDGGPGPADAGSSRAYRLAATGVQPYGRDYAEGAADLAADVDVVSLHQDFYGVPWDAFATGGEPPAEWVATMDHLAAIAGAKPIFLSLQLVGGVGRRFLAGRAVVKGGKVVIQDWSAECYDFATAPDAAEKRLAYERYVDWMVRRFHPAWVNVAIEINAFASCGDAAWAGLVPVLNAAYDAAKAADPGVVAFPSFLISRLYGYDAEVCQPPSSRADCFEAAYAQLAGVKRDRFAVSTYPYLGEELRDASALPADLLYRAAARRGERLVVAETGWIATDVVGRLGDACVTAIPSTPERQAAYFDFLIATAAVYDVDLITWFSDRDIIPAEVMTDCPCDFDPDWWCALVDLHRKAGGADPTAQFRGETRFKIWGTMGLRTHDGAPRQPIFERWKAARAIPLR